MSDEGWVRRQLALALIELVREHASLFTHDVNERSITHWLAAILAPLFPDWDVDCEYNRNGVDPKKLPLTPSHVPSDDSEARTVFPDVIIHQRGEPENLLVIEAKKARGRADYARDLQKLSVFVARRAQGGLEYRFGALVVFHTEETPPRAEIANWFQGS